jgi:hypothetical protein
MLFFKLKAVGWRVLLIGVGGGGGGDCDAAVAADPGGAPAAPDKGNFLFFSVTLSNETNHRDGARDACTRCLTTLVCFFELRPRLFRSQAAPQQLST